MNTLKDKKNYRLDDWAELLKPDKDRERAIRISRGPRIASKWFKLVYGGWSKRQSGLPTTSVIELSELYNPGICAVIQDLDIYGFRTFFGDKRNAIHNSARIPNDTGSRPAIWYAYVALTFVFE